jgi:hypothetical protein
VRVGIGITCCPRYPAAPWGDRQGAGTGFSEMRRWLSGAASSDCGGRGWAGAGWCGGAGAGKVGEDGLDGEGVRQQAGCALRTRGVGDLLTTSPTPGHAMKNVSRSAPSSGRHSHRLLSGRAFSRSWSPFSETATMVCCRRSVPPSRLRTVARPGCGSSTGGTARGGSRPARSQEPRHRHRAVRTTMNQLRVGYTCSPLAQGGSRVRVADLPS